jgi:hypothetical protein
LTPRSTSLLGRGDASVGNGDIPAKQNELGCNGAADLADAAEDKSVAWHGVPLSGLALIQLNGTWSTSQRQGLRSMLRPR